MLFAIAEFFGAMLSLFIALGSLSHEKPPEGIDLFFLGSAIILTIVFVIHQWRFRSVRKNRTISERKFFRFMAKEIIKSKNSKVTIVSGELGWANDRQVRNALSSKGSKLTILMERSTPVSDILKSKGVKILEYGGEIAAPISRFTFIDLGATCRVHVGWPVPGNDDQREVWTYEIGKHPFIQAAKDMIAALTAAAERKLAASSPSGGA